MFIPRKKECCQYDEISLGEVMLRLDPGEGRIRSARAFRVWEGGGEYNTARGLRKCFGLKTAVVTAFADNEVGRLAEDLIMQGGVDTSFIKWAPYDGVGRSARNGLNFTERGYGIRGAVGVSDRANTAVSQLRPGDIDWEYIFGQCGARWFHTGGIFAALSETTAQVTLEAVQCARKHGTLVSYDFNYRPSLMNGIEGQPSFLAINQEIIQNVDVLMGNKKDFTACLGLKAEGNTEHLSTFNIDDYKKMTEQVAAVYPSLRVIASTLRTVKSASVNDWSAVGWANGEVYTGIALKDLDILDRVGGGDSFAAGLIYGLLHGYSLPLSLNYGICHGALAMTTPGDTSMASLKEVEALLKGSDASVQR